MRRDDIAENPPEWAPRLLLMIFATKCFLESKNPRPRSHPRQCQQHFCRYCQRILTDLQLSKCTYYKFSLEVAKDVFVWFPRSRGSVDNFSDFPPMMPDLPETLLAEGKFNQVLVNDDLKYFVFEVGGRIRNEC